MSSIWITSHELLVKLVLLQGRVSFVGVACSRPAHGRLEPVSQDLFSLILEGVLLSLVWVDVQYVCKGTREA